MPQVSMDELPVLIFLLGQRVVYRHPPAATNQLLRVRNPGVAPFLRPGPAVRRRCPFWSIFIFDLLNFFLRALVQFRNFQARLAAYS